MKKILFYFLLLALTTQLYAQQTLQLKDLKGTELHNRVRLNFIPVAMPTDLHPDIAKTMGLMGVHYQVPINKWLYGGVAMHAAVTGDQGGLFTLGIELGNQLQLYKNLYLDTNIHFGGGGGYRYLINDGAFLNPNIGLEYKYKNSAFGIQYSHVNFYTGSIKSNSISFYLQLENTIKLASYEHANKQYALNNSSETNTWSRKVNKSALQIRFDYFSPIGNSRKDNNNDQEPLTNTLHVLGFEYQKYINPNTFSYIHTDAIYKGLRAGFMDLFLGMGYNIANSKHLHLATKFAIGAAGGRVAPEGGLMMYPNLELDVAIAKNTGISTHIGYYRAIGGDLEAYTYGFGLKHYILSGGTQQTNATSNYSKYHTQGIRVSLQNQTYLNATRFHLAPIDLQLLAIKVNYDLNKTFYLTGDAGFAYDGESGGYAHGLAGIGANSPYFLYSKLQAYLESSIGAAGGGGIDTGEGIVIRPNIGLRYSFSNTLAIESSIGKMIAPNGTLNATNYNIGITFSFTSLQVKS